MSQPGGLLHGTRGRRPHRAVPPRLERGPTPLEPALPHPRRGRSTPCSTSRGAITTARPTGTRGCRITLVRRTGAGQTGVPPVFRTSGYETYATGAGPPDLGPRGRRGKPSGG